MSNIEAFENGGWSIDDDNLSNDEHGYHVRAADLNRGDSEDRYDMLIHILSKNWVDPMTFVPVYRRALDRFEMFKLGRWEATMRAVRQAAYASLCDREAERRGAPDPEKFARELFTNGWDGRRVR